MKSLHLDGRYYEAMKVHSFSQHRYSDCRSTHSFNIFQHLWVPYLIKEFGPDSISLILPVMAFVPIKTPVEPIQIVLFEQFHQVIPWNILLIASKLAHNEGNPIPKPSHIEFLVKYLLSEGLLGTDVPKAEDPGEAVEMAGIDEFVGKFEYDRCLGDLGQIELVVDAPDNNQPVRRYVL